MNFVGVSVYDWFMHHKILQYCFVQLQIETFSTPSYIGALELWEHAGKLETQPLKAQKKEDGKEENFQYTSPQHT